jgi:EAL domain-containing protein (putative c-di-GMP-specific phosphodiesterase class I)
MSRSLFPVFQSIVNRRLEPVGYESLIRGRRSASVIRMFHRADPAVCQRIVRYDRWCKILAVNAYSHRLPLFLNSHPFSELQLPEPVLQAPRPIVIEITEQARHTDQLIYRIQRLREFGVEFAIDDFGTGFTDLPLVMKIKPKYVKIAKEIIHQAHSSGQQKTLAAIYELCRSLGSQVIAEGIESKELFKSVAPFADAFQGYWIGRPQELQILTSAK